MVADGFIEGTNCVSYPQGWPKSVEIKTYDGGCHCGQFRYEFEFPDIHGSKVVSCDCSICVVKGALNMYALRSSLYQQILKTRVYF